VLIGSWLLSMNLKQPVPALPILSIALLLEAIVTLLLVFEAHINSPGN